MHDGIVVCKTELNALKTCILQFLRARVPETLQTGYVRWNCPPGANWWMILIDEKFASHCVSRRWKSYVTRVSLLHEWRNQTRYEHKLVNLDHTNAVNERTFEILTIRRRALVIAVANTVSCKGSRKITEGIRTGPSGVYQLYPDKVG